MGEISKKIAKKFRSMPAYYEFLLILLISIILVDLYGFTVLWIISLLLVAFAIYRVWKFKDYARLAMDQVETTLWGKPLKKEYWKKGEFRQRLKNTKLKLKWQKKKSAKEQTKEGHDV